MRPGAILTGMLALCAPCAAGLAGETYDNGAQVFNVKASYGGQPGARGSDTGDDGPAIQRAINAAQAAHGGIVFLPGGTYRLASGLTLGGGITLQGSGWNRDGKAGTWLHVTADGFVPLSISFDGSGVKDLAFIHDQPAVGPGWAPNLKYPYTIQLTGLPAQDRRGVGAPYASFIRDVLLLNPTRGVLQASAHGAAGLLHIERLYGQPLYRGLEIQDMEDVLHVNDLHFGAIWSTDPNVASYTRANAVAIVSYRNDEPVFQDVFFLRYLMGFEFLASPDPNVVGSKVTSGFHIANYHCDECYEGIRIWNAAETQGSVTNLDVANNSIPGSVGVNVIDSPDVTLLLDNVHILNSGASNIWVHRENAQAGGNPVVMIDNLIADGWDTANQGWASLGAGANCTLIVGFNRTFKTTKKDALTSGAVTLAH